MKCPVCDSEELEKVSEIRKGTQLINYYVMCRKCGCDWDAFDINDRIYEWDKLPQKRKFTELLDYRDEGNGVVETTYDLDDENMATRSSNKKLCD